jgi:hypothetical protein
MMFPNVLPLSLKDKEPKITGEKIEPEIKENLKEEANRIFCSSPSCAFCFYILFSIESPHLTLSLS